MKAIITGHKGYIGSKLYEQCKKIGWDVIGVDLKENNRDVNYISHYKDCVDFGANLIFHMAAIPAVQYSVENPSETCYHNVLATSNVLQFAVKNKIKRVIFSSSSAVYGENGFPLSPYGLQKLQSEMDCFLFSKLYGLETVCLRYFNVYSPNQIPTTSYPTVISAWMKAIREKKDCLVYGDGTQSRDYIHLDDIIACNLFVGSSSLKFKGDCFDVGTGISNSVNYIKDYIITNYEGAKFINLPERTGDIKMSISNVENLKKIGWSAKIIFKDGLKDCFSKENLK